MRGQERLRITDVSGKVSQTITGSPGSAVTAIRDFGSDKLAQSLWCRPGAGRFAPGRAPDLTASHLAYLICALAFGPPTSAAKTAHACRALRLNQPAPKAAASFAEDLLGTTLVETIARILEGLMTDRREEILAIRPTVAVRTMPAITEGELRITQAGHTHSFAFRIRQREQRSPPVEKLTVLNTEIFAEAAALLAQRLHPNSPASAAGGSAPRQAGHRKAEGRRGLAPATPVGNPSATPPTPVKKSASAATRGLPQKCGVNPNAQDNGQSPISTRWDRPEVIPVSVSADAFCESPSDDPPQEGQQHLLLD